MSKQTTPLYPMMTDLPICGMGQASVANTNRDGTGTLATVVTASGNGLLIARISIKAIVTTTAGMVRLFIFDGSSTTRLFREYVVSAITPAASVKTWEVEEAFYDLKLPSSYALKASTHNAEAFNVIAFGGAWSS